MVSGLAQHLTRAHQLSPIKDVSCAFAPVGTSEFKKLDGKNTTCSIFVYRVSHNEHARNPRNGLGPGRPPLAVNMLGLGSHLHGGFRDRTFTGTRTVPAGSEDYSIPTGLATRVNFLSDPPDVYLAATHAM